MFRGITNLNLDAKGRLAMPARHRESLAADNSQLVVTVDMHSRCLAIYPRSTWERLEKEIDALPSTNRMAAYIKRMLIGHATDVTLDAAGRVLIPPELRAYAGLEKACVLAGMGKKFELWDAEAWSALSEQFLSEIEGENLPAALESLSL
ncbi:MAG TPA: transcriptional regulator MraZ [Halothiobacillus sp.]|nr:transcriptional regulator MraZ [Halothiobacillus sp.]